MANLNSTVITGSLSVTGVIKSNGISVSLDGHTHGNASSTSAGFMSSSDKSKLDGIAANANNYSLPMASSSTRGGSKLTIPLMEKIIN